MALGLVTTYGEFGMVGMALIMARCSYICNDEQSMVA